MLALDLVYIGFVLANDRSGAPIRGRVDGLRTWRADRLAAAPHRRSIDLPALLGFGAALRRARGGR